MAGLLLVTVMLVIVSGQFGSGGPGCKSRGLCCQGKNNTCRSTRLDNIKAPVRKTKLKVKEGEGVTPPSSDDKKKNNDKGDDNDKGKSKSCFCDSACLDLGDCCEDYKNFCKRKLSKTHNRSS